MIVVLALTNACVVSRVCIVVHSHAGCMASHVAAHAVLLAPSASFQRQQVVAALLSTSATLPTRAASRLARFESSWLPANLRFPPLLQYIRHSMRLSGELVGVLAALASY